MELSRRGFLGVVGAAIAAPAVSPSTSLMRVSGFLEGEHLSIEVPTPPEMVIDRERYWTYELDHILGPLKSIETLIQGLTIEKWWRKNVIIDHQNGELFIPHEGLTKSWLDCEETRTAWWRLARRWISMKSVVMGHLIQPRSSPAKINWGNDLTIACFTNPALWTLAVRSHMKYSAHKNCEVVCTQ